MKPSVEELNAVKARDVLQFLIKDAPEGTCSQTSIWLYENVPQEALKQALRIINAAITTHTLVGEDTEADSLRDDADVIWYALDEPTREELRHIWA